MPNQPTTAQEYELEVMDLLFRYAKAGEDERCAQLTRFVNSFGKRPKWRRVYEALMQKVRELEAQDAREH